MDTTPHAHPRLDYSAQAPTQFKKYLDFALSFKMDKKLALLVDIRASQLNGCAFCLDMHVKEAKLAGERELRLHHVAIWRESALFDPKERAALLWTETLTRLPEGGVPDAVYAQVRERFPEPELAELSFRIVAINGWNRLNVAFRTPPGVQDRAYGLDKAGLA
jgi:AhpD family alkylhydroperoxidase